MDTIVSWIGVQIIPLVYTSFVATIYLVLTPLNP